MNRLTQGSSGALRRLGVQRRSCAGNLGERPRIFYLRVADGGGDVQSPTHQPQASCGVLKSSVLSPNHQTVEKVGPRRGGEQ